MLLSVLLAILTVELKDIIHAVACLGGMCITIGALFWMLNAPYVAVFQLTVYGGAVIALFLAAIALTREKVIKREKAGLG